jgi:hypothetical protein
MSVVTKEQLTAAVQMRLLPGRFKVERDREGWPIIPGGWDGSNGTTQKGASWPSTQIVRGCSRGCWSYPASGGTRPGTGFARFRAPRCES